MLLVGLTCNSFSIKGGRDTIRKTSQIYMTKTPTWFTDLTKSTTCSTHILLWSSNSFHHTFFSSPIQSYHHVLLASTRVVRAHTVKSYHWSEDNLKYWGISDTKFWIFQESLGSLNLLIYPTQNKIKPPQSIMFGVEIKKSVIAGLKPSLTLPSIQLSWLHTSAASELLLTPYQVSFN